MLFRSATYIGNEMDEKERKIRGVKQQSLYVTWQTIVPSVLVEVGYITNPEERAFMTSKDLTKMCNSSLGGTI